MNWSDVVREVETAPETLAAISDVELIEMAKGDPILWLGLRALQRETGARTFGELRHAPEVEGILRTALPRQERSAFFKAMSGAVRRLARETPSIVAVAGEDDIPRGGDALEEWAARFGIVEALDETVRVTTSPRDRSGVVFRVREIVDVVLFPVTGQRLGLDRESLRTSGVELLRAAVKEAAPKLLVREAFLSRRRPPEDTWLKERVALLRTVADKDGALSTQRMPLRLRYPLAPVRFESHPPSLAIRMQQVEHVVSLTDGRVQNRGGYWNGSQDYGRLTQALVECALDALSDPEGAVAAEILEWRRTPVHEHVLADFQRALVKGRPLVTMSEEEPERLAFRITSEHADPPQAILQRQRKNGGFTAGRKVSATEALRAPGLTPLDREIVEMCALIDNGRFHVPGDPYRAKVRVFELLTEHPHVHLDDAAKTPVRVRRARACLRVAPCDGGFRFELAIGGAVPLLDAEAANRNRFVVALDPSAGTVNFAELDETTLALLAALEANPGALGADGVDALLGVLATRSEVAVDLALPEELRGKPVAADERLVVQLALSPDRGLGLALRVRPLARGPALLPGTPPRHAYGAANDGARVFATRNLDDEEARAEHLLAELPLAGAERRGPFDVRIDDPERSCDVVATLAELADTGAVVTEWESGARLRVAKTLTTKSLKLRIDRKRDWFGITGGADVDGKTIGIHALLEAARANHRFIRLGGGELVAIGRDLRARLERADDLLEQRKKDGIVAHSTALSAVEDLVEDEEQLTAAKEWLELRARVRKAEASEPELPKGLLAELRPYQLEGYRWLMRLAACGSGGCLADDMGLGKTVQSLAVLLARAELGPALVLAPTSVCPNWISEAARFAPGLDVVDYRGPGRRERLEWLGNGSVLVTSYDLLLRDIDEIAPLRFATAFFDEAHALKNAQSKRAGAVRELQADVRFALSGTPIENHTGELWSLFRVVAPGLFGSWERFRERFAGPIERDADPARRSALASIVKPYLLRRTKKEVSPELPPRTEIVRFVALSPSERELYEAERIAAVEATKNAASKEAGPEGRFALLAALTRLRQLACHPRLRFPESSTTSSKLRSVLDLVDELQTAGHRALVFSQFTGHLALVAEALAARGVTFLELNGSTPADDRADRVRRFQAGEATFFLISLKAGGTGLNLTAADYVLHLDPWWNPAAEDQASDRAHRIGQDKPVTVVRFIARGTIEESVLALHDDKRELAAAVLSGGDAAGRLSTSELFALMEKSAADEGAAEHDESRED